MVLTTTNKEIKYLSRVYRGTNHDYGIFKKEFPVCMAKKMEPFQIHVDLGYLGIKKDYPFLKVLIPDKKPPKKQLTDEQKKENTLKSSQRVKVENAIGGMKRYRFLSDRLRCRNTKLYSKVAGVAAGLWNFNLNC
jgi:hypothetical protein